MQSSTLPIPDQPAAHHVYGELIYWLSIAASVVCIIGPFMALVQPDGNVLNPHYLFFSIWQGKTPLLVWTESGSSFPGAHFWMNNLAKGDGLIQFGIVLGCLSGCIALFGTGIAYLKKPREIGWAILALLIGAAMVAAALGVLSCEA